MHLCGAEWFSPYVSVKVSVAATSWSHLSLGLKGLVPIPVHLSFFQFLTDIVILCSFLSALCCEQTLINCQNERYVY